MEKRQLGDPDLLEKLLWFLRAATIDAYGNDVKVLAAKRLLEAIEARHLFTARRTPRRPEVEQNELAKRVLQLTDYTALQNTMHTLVLMVLEAKSLQP